MASIANDIVRDAVRGALVASVVIDGIGVMTANVAQQLFPWLGDKNATKGRGINLADLIKGSSKNAFNAFTPYLARRLVKGIVLSSGMSLPLCGVIILTTSALAGAYKYWSKGGYRGRDESSAWKVGIVDNVLYSLVDLLRFDNNILGCILSYSTIEFICGCYRKHLAGEALDVPDLKELFKQELIASSAISIVAWCLFGITDNRLIGPLTGAAIAPLMGAITASGLLAYNLYLCDTQQYSSKAVSNCSIPLLAASVIATATGAPLLSVGGICTVGLMVFAVESCKYNISVCESGSTRS